MRGPLTPVECIPVIVVNTQQPRVVRSSAELQPKRRETCVSLVPTNAQVAAAALRRSAARPQRMNKSPASERENPRLSARSEQMVTHALPV